MNHQSNILKQEAIQLLKQLIATPSFSREEDPTAALIEQWLQQHGIRANRLQNNVWATGAYFNPALPCLLLNSHQDTVKPNKNYTLNPFTPVEQDGKLYGLGSNDAGGALVSLMATFLLTSHIPNNRYNIIFAATAEEEISGVNGIELLLQDAAFKTACGPQGIACGIVGEPTLMNMAIAERGLLVLDCMAAGIAGHAAREEGDNALYKAITDIEWFRHYRFEKISEVLGPVKMNVTVIETDNKAHNVVPAQCKFVVDVRVNECYSFDEILHTIRQHVTSTVQPRSMRLRSTGIALNHPLVRAGLQLHRSYYGSPTTSDKALMPFPTLKMGPGDSARSHTADEFIFIQEIEEGIDLYTALVEQLLNN